MKNMIPCDYCLYTINETDSKNTYAIGFRVNDENYYFCSEDCLDKWIDEHTEGVCI